MTKRVQEQPRIIPEAGGGNSCCTSGINHGDVLCQGYRGADLASSFHGGSVESPGHKIGNRMTVVLAGPQVPLPPWFL